MVKAIRLTVPMRRGSLMELRAGDRVLISGEIYTARDAAHVRLCELIKAGDALPIDLVDSVIYFVGPTPPRPSQAIGAAGPTTSSRMDRFSPMLYEHGLAGTIGKGYRSEEVIESLKQNRSVHFTALGGAGALLSKCVKSAQLVAYEELGTEAIRRLIIADFPAVVAYDAYGQSVYER